MNYYFSSGLITNLPPDHGDDLDSASASGSGMLAGSSSDSVSSSGSLNGGGSLDKKRANNNPLISDTEKCRVCGEAAARHIHYGAITCFSCRAFFRRSIQNRSTKQYTCRKGNNCVINLKTRKNCQKCRFDKCVEAGMKESWVLSEEERFRRFRKHREKMQKRKRDEEDDHLLQQQVNSPEFQLPSSIKRRISEEMASASSASMAAAPTEPMDLSHHQEANTCLVERPAWPSSMHGLNVAAISSHPLLMGSLNNPSGIQSTPRRFEPMTMTFPASASSTNSTAMVPLGSTWHQPQKLKAEIKDSDDEEVEEINANANTSNEEVDSKVDTPDINQRITGISRDEVETIQRIAYLHDRCYKSVNFGEDLIKEMLFSSVCGIPLSAQSTMTAYRLMISRVHKVASGFDPFARLSERTQRTLLRHNADLVVSLRGAIFFESRKQGLDQIVITLGVNDCEFARRIIRDAKQQRINKIDYTAMNSLQKIDRNNPDEQRYHKLLDRVGSTITFDTNLSKLLTYVLLFMSDFPSEDVEAEMGAISSTQETMITMLQRYIYATYPKELAVILFSRVVSCIGYLQDLTWIKKKRELATNTSVLLEEDKILTEANKPKAATVLPE